MRPVASELGGLRPFAGARPNAVGAGEVPIGDELFPEQMLVEEVGDQANLGTAGCAGDRDELAPRAVTDAQVLDPLLLPRLGEEAVLREDRGHFLDQIGSFQVPHSREELCAFSTSPRLEELLDHLVLAARVEELHELSQKLAVPLGEEPASGGAQPVHDFRPAWAGSPHTGAFHQPVCLEGLEMVPDGFPGEPGHCQLGDGRLPLAFDLTEK